MPKVRLTDISLQSLRPPLSGNTDYWDTTLPTFGLRVSSKGTKTFVLKIYNARQAIGRYPVISLSEARTEAKRRLAEKTLGKGRPQSLTFQQALKLYVEDKRQRRRPRTVSEYERQLKRLNFNGQVSDIGHGDIERKLKAFRHTPSEYNHTLTSAKIFFNWCLKRRYVTENPCFGLSGNARPARSRVLSDEELGSIWLACEDQTNDLPSDYRKIVQLLVLSGQRRGEISALHRSHCSHNEQTIALHGHLVKNHRQHVFPVGPMAASILWLAVRESEGLLFPARGKVDTPFCGWSKAKRQLDKASGVKAWTLHDLRRTFATRIAEMGVAPHIIERLLNHVTGSLSAVALIYNRARYMREMRDAIELWEKQLSSIMAKPLIGNERVRPEGSYVEQSCA